MTKTRDWDVKTGWEKRIKVDFGSIGRNHVRWSHWTDMERDIVARKVHESATVSKLHGPRSRRMEDWAVENAPIMIDFARDHKPMPDWAHADYRPSGIPDHVQVIWKRNSSGDPASKGDWAYDPPLDDPYAATGPDRQLTDQEVAEKQSQGMWSDQTYIEGVGWCILDGENVVGRSPNSMQIGRPVRQSDGSMKWENPHPDSIASGLAGQPGADGPQMQDSYIEVGELYWAKGSKRLLVPVDILSYPDNMNELLGMVESKDPTRGGWVTMSALEALGSGLASTRTETVRNAAKIDFVVPLSYSIQKYEQAEFKFYFRKSNSLGARPEYLEFTRFMPANTVVKNNTFKADQRIVDTVRGYWQGNLNKPNKGENWRRVLIAFGVEEDDGAGPFTVAEALKGEKQWSGWKPVREELERLEASKSSVRDPIEDANRYREAVGLPPVEKSQSDKLRDALVKTNEREDVVVKEFDPNTGTLVEIKMTPEQKREKELNEYKYSPPIQGNYTVKDWVKSGGSESDVVFVYSEYGEGLYIVDPQVRIPLWKVDGDSSTVTGSWRWKNEEWTYLGKGVPGSNPGPTGDPGVSDYTLEVISDIEQAMAEGNWNLVAKLALEEAAKS